MTWICSLIRRAKRGLKVALYNATARPALGYVDHPPLAPLVLAAVQHLFGGSLLALRLVPALLRYRAVAAGFRRGADRRGGLVEPVVGGAGPGVPELRIRQTSDSQLDVMLHSVTPNLKTYVVRTNDGPWHPISDDRFRWLLESGKNTLEAGLPGPELGHHPAGEQAPGADAESPPEQGRLLP